MDSFVVIDFETASLRSTPIQVGLIEVTDGVPGRSEEFFIFQEASRFDSFSIQVHGIYPEDVRDAVRWPEALAEIVAFIAGRPVIAHFAQFDIGVIRDACDEWKLPWPEFTYACTVVIGRHVWPEMPSHSLGHLAPALGVSMDATKRHKALYDAMLTALVVKKAMIDTSTTTLDELLVVARVWPGLLAPTEWGHCHGKQHQHRAKDIEVNAGADSNGALYGQKIAFTGAMSMSRTQAQQIVATAGGIPQDNVRKDTTYLVMGYQDKRVLAEGQTQSSKLRKVLNMREAGSQVELVDEVDFLRLLAA
jgi:DNA polymerase-3 subunit epsilon